MDQKKTLSSQVLWHSGTPVLRNLKTLELKNFFQPQ